MPRPPILRPPALLAAALGLFPAAAPGADPGRPILPKTVSLNQPNGTLARALAELARQAGFPVEPPADAAALPCPVTFENVPAWDALGRIADRSGTRIELHDHGRRMVLAKRTGPRPPASVDGPFRVAVRQVRSVRDFDTGQSVTELALDIHWEPQVMVFRLDAEPTITEAADDQGDKITVATNRSKTPPVGVVYTTTVRLTGVPRGATKLTRVAGTITVTAADRMLGFSFHLSSNSPPPQEKDGVTAAVARAGKVDDRYEVEVALTYPPNHPEFESFESFVTENRAALTAGGKSWPAGDTEVSSSGRRVTAVYRFPGTVPAGATFEYATPAPLREYPVRFDLRDIPLP